MVRKHKHIYRILIGTGGVCDQSQGTVLLLLKAGIKIIKPDAVHSIRGQKILRGEIKGIRMTIPVGDGYLSLCAICLLVDFIVSHRCRVVHADPFFTGCTPITQDDLDLTCIIKTPGFIFDGEFIDFDFRAVIKEDRFPRHAGLIDDLRHC